MQVLLEPRGRTVSPIIRTCLRDGSVLEGVVEDGLAVYRGVHYAHRPFGDLRFQAPKPVAPWHGVKTAHHFAPASPQAPRDPAAAMFGGEDCLALNVWAPEGGPTQCPVMVWIPGGAYMRGNAGDPIYDGAAFARAGIVFVSVNYRVGIDGFMAIPGAPANRGLLDIVCALQWITRNIASFGGDPSCITLAGGSAGAGAITCLLGMPRARGLFHRAMLQSPSVATHTAAEAKVAATAIAALLEVPLTCDAMSRVPLPRAVAVLKTLADDPALRRDMGFSSRNFFPLRAVVDGSLLQAPPLTSLSSAWRLLPHDFSLLVGCNREEMRLYTVPTGRLDSTTAEDLQEFARDAGLTRQTLGFYEGLSLDQRSKPGPGEALCALQSDYFYRVPARKIAAGASAHGVRAHLYEFDWSSDRYGGKLGAAHGLEVPFVFNRLLAPEAREITGPDAPPALAEHMHRACTAFVKTGNPGWTPYDPQHASLMHFDTESRCEPDRWRFSEELWEAVQ